MYKDKGKQRDAKRKWWRENRTKLEPTRTLEPARTLEPPIGAGVTDLKVQVPLHGTCIEMESIIAHYDPSMVTKALSGYKQPNTWGHVP